MDIEKRLKKHKAYGIVGYGGIGLMLAGLGCLLVAIPFDSKPAEIAKENGYDEFNKTYKQQVFDDLILDYQNGEISKETLIDKGEHIKDYDYEKFIYEYTTPEAIDELESAKKTKGTIAISASVVETAGLASAIIGMFGMASTDPRRKTRKILQEVENADDTNLNHVEESLSEEQSKEK